MSERTPEEWLDQMGFRDYCGDELSGYDAALAAWEADRARIATLKAQRDALVAALEPFARFDASVEAQPIRGVASQDLPDDKPLYAIHTGTQYEAEITLGHIRAATAALAAIEAERETTTEGGQDDA